MSGNVTTLQAFPEVVRLVFRQRGYLALGLLLFLGLLTLYLFLLPGAYTGGRIGLISLRYLNGPLIFFAVALAAAASLTLTFNVYGFRAASIKRVQGGGAGTGVGLASLLASVLPTMLCCTPLVPTALALLGASTPTIFGMTGKIQGFFATYELHFLTAALLLLGYALHRSVRHLTTSCGLPRPQPGPSR